MEEGNLWVSDRNVGSKWQKCGEDGGSGMGGVGGNGDPRWWGKVKWRPTRGEGGSHERTGQEGCRRRERRSEALVAPRSACSRNSGGSLLLERVYKGECRRCVLGCHIAWGPSSFASNTVSQPSLGQPSNWTVWVFCLFYLFVTKFKGILGSHGDITIHTGHLSHLCPQPPITPSPQLSLMDTHVSFQGYFVHW